MAEAAKDGKNLFSSRPHGGVFFLDNYPITDETFDLMDSTSTFAGVVSCYATPTQHRPIIQLEY